MEVQSGAHKKSFLVIERVISKIGICKYIHTSPGYFSYIIYGTVGFTKKKDIVALVH